jgi:hypothetical protein
LAKDLHAAMKEVQAAEASSTERASAETVPNTPEIAPDRAIDAPSAMLREEPIELRASARFDSMEGLARLAVLRSGEDSGARAGWTVPLKQEPRVIDRARVAIVLAYALAFVAAVTIAVFA